MTEIVAEISQQARRSPHVNQRSGVSVRLSIANYETLVANAMRRALRNGEHEVVPRVSDLDALVASTAGKIEIETIDDGREGQVLERILKASVLEVFRSRVRAERLAELVRAFDDGRVVHTGEDVPSVRVRDARRTRRPGCARRSVTSASARRRPGWPRRSSSCSRACTSRSGSTRTRSAAAPPTAPAADAPKSRSSSRRRSGRPVAAVRGVATSPCACTSRSPDRLGGSRCRPRSRSSGCRRRTCRPA